MPIDPAVPAAAPALTVIIPVCNECESLAKLHEEIVAVLEAERLSAEILFIDDGSRDTSWAVIETLCARDARVRGIRFRRNFGKAAALAAGFARIRGNVVVTMDADLQDDPREVPAFLRRLDGGLDLVTGWKRKRFDPWHKVFPSRVFNGMVSRLTGVPLHDHNCGMKAFRAEVARKLRMYGERHRFVPVLAASLGYRVGEMEIHHRSRKFGRSKYGFTRFIKGFLDLLAVAFQTRYGLRPMHMLGTVGLIALALGIAGGLAWLIGLTCGVATMVEFGLPAAVLTIAGVQCLLTGLVSELLTARTTEPGDGFDIASEIG